MTSLLVPLGGTKRDYSDSGYNSYRPNMVAVVQLVRTPDCGSGGRVFESRQPPHRQTQQIYFLQKRLFWD